MREPILTGKALARYWAKVDKRGDDECWPWNRSLSAGKDGYGHLNINRVIFDSHRLTWALTYGAIPDGMHVLHKCDYKPCCNPRHLFLGTHADNMADMKAKGKAKGGPGRVKLNEEQVREIRRLKTEGWTCRQLAKKYDMDHSVMSDITARRTWKNVI